MKTLPLTGIGALLILSIACSTSSSLNEHTHFSRLDSLTDAYLVLNDSVLQSWNRVISTEIDKSRNLREAVNDLDNQHLLSDEARESFEVRLEQLEKIRFTQATIADPQVVQDYDVAYQSIVTDLSRLSKSSTLNVFESLQTSSLTQRKSYDQLAKIFNEFVQKNRQALKDIEENEELVEKPLFVGIKH